MQDILQIALQGKRATAISLYFMRYNVDIHQAINDVDALMRDYNLHNAPMQVSLAAAAEYEEAIMGRDIYDNIVGG